VIVPLLLIFTNLYWMAEPAANGTVIVQTGLLVV
jgi:hypothetical protein